MPRLRHAADWQSLAYLLAAPLLVVLQWRQGFSLPAWGVLLFLSVGISTVHHNHMHYRMWDGRWMNRATDLLLSLWQGHPGMAFLAAHNANHHRHHQGPGDIARTWRFRGGDSNHLIGWLLHPFQAVGVLYPHLWRWLRRARQRRPAAAPGTVAAGAGPVPGLAVLLGPAAGH